MEKEVKELDKKLFLLFKRAVDSERKAQSMYKEILSCLDDKDLIKIFEGFLKDEERHEKKVIEEYNRLKKTLEEIEEVK